MKELEKHTCFGGELIIFEHESDALSCTMKFSVFLPEQAKQEKVPFITFLSGLTCTHENFTTKSGAYGAAAREGIAIVAPDTSPRGKHVPDDADMYDFGKGAGFYINATQQPWSEHYQMERYVVDELNALVCSKLPLKKERQGICGHSMGGHGALTLGLKYPDIYKSISAFSPIVAPTKVPWGQKAFERYLGNDLLEWKRHDACELIKSFEDREKFPVILIDQGLADPFLEEQLKPELFEIECQNVGQKMVMRKQSGYDHSYYFIQSFIQDHIKHHSQILKR